MVGIKEEDGRVVSRGKRSPLGGEESGAFTFVPLSYSPWARMVNANGHHHAGRRVLLVPHLPGRGLLLPFSPGPCAGRERPRGRQRPRGRRAWEG